MKSDSQQLSKAQNEMMSEALRQTAPDLLAYFERRVERDDAADLLGETMVVGWLRAVDLPEMQEVVRMWLFGIARNVLLSAQRGERRRLRLAARLRTVTAAASLTAPAADRGLEIRDAISRLEPQQAELVRLILWEGFTIAQAAEHLGMPARTARGRYQTARTQLWSALL